MATPPTIAPPACAIPTVTPPTVAAPNIPTPQINAPTISVPTLTAPTVVAPPTVTPPTVAIPVVNAPNIPNPSLPPNVPPPSQLPTLPTGPVVILPPRPPLNCDTQLLSNRFTLTFQYACREGVAFQSCLADIVWNNVVVYSVVPTDYEVRTVTLSLAASAGRNSLQIEGAGVSDSFGLTVDNVQLVRFGTADNIVVNGGFEQPNQYGSWGIFNDISGWRGSAIEVGQGSIYNGRWSSQVVELDGNANFQITQYFTFDNLFHLIGDAGVAACNNPFPNRVLKYTLEFDWAARLVGFNNLDSSKGNVLWNNVVIGSLIADPSNQGVNHASFEVVLNAGDNVLQFDGASLSDSYGISIDKVKLTSPYNSSNLIVNGDFQPTAGLALGQYAYINGGIQGWAAAKAELGDCRLYNSHWGATFCIELDSDSNQRYTQVITISQQLYSSLVLYIAQVLGDNSVYQTTSLAINNANIKASNALQQINHAVQCSVAFTAGQFNRYLQNLYQCSTAAVQHVAANQLLEISQYSCASSEWLQYFGESGELDFSCDGYSSQFLTNAWCTIISINGKVIHCNDGRGDYHLQISPCSHIEGQSHLPQIGEKIFWKGSQSSSGNVYVMVATTCDC